MSDVPGLVLAFLTGAALGVFFFVGLWWTVQKGVASANPAIWFLGSLLLRTSVILAGFYFVSEGRWRSLAACLLGLAIARYVIVSRLTSNSIEELTPREKETRIAH